MRILKPLSGSKAGLTCAAVLATGAAGWATGEQFVNNAPLQTAEYASTNIVRDFTGTQDIETSAVEIGTLVAEASVGGAASDAAPPSFSRIVIDKTGVSRIDGDGTPGSQVLIKSEGRVIGAAVVGENGRWAVALDKVLSAGDHRLTSVAAGGDEVRPGEEVRVFIPPDFIGEDVVAYDRATAKKSPTAEDRASDLATKANKRFSVIVPEPVTAAQAPEAASLPQELAQSEPAQAAESAAAADGSGEKTSSETATDMLSSGVETVRSWLKDASEIYQRDVAGRLSKPTGEAVVNDGDSPADAARKITEDRQRKSKAWDDAEAREAAQNAERDRAAAAEAERRAALDSEAKAVRERQAQAETERKAAEAKKLEDNMKRLEEAAARDVAPKQQAQPPSTETAEAKPGPSLADRARKLFFQVDEGSVRDKPAPRPQDIEDDSDLRAGAKVPRDDSQDSRSSDNGPRKLEFTVEPERKERSRVTGWRERTYDNQPRHKQRQSCGSHTRVKKGSKPQLYVVQDGETLWSIARRYYGSGMRYQKIYNANLRRMPSPHVVRPCQRIILPGRRIHAFLMHPQV